MPIDPSALKTELTTDPVGMGYVLATPIEDSDVGNIRTLINASGRTVDRELAENREVVEAIRPAEFEALSVEKRDLVLLMLQPVVLDLRNANIRSAFASAFGAGTTTRTNLIALQTKTGSRAEELFGESVTVGSRDIARALRI